MIDESEVCTVIKNSFLAQNYFAYKIPDPSSDYISTIKRPFDIIAVGKGYYYIEAKFMNKLQSFNLSRIEDHQIEALLQIKELQPGAECWIALGIKVSRGDNRIYVFDDIQKISERRKNKENYLKKELELLPYYEVHKNLIDIKDI